MVIAKWQVLLFLRGMKKNIMGSDEGSLCASMWGYARRLAFEQEPEYSILLGILQDEIECTHWQ